LGIITSTAIDGGVSVTLDEMKAMATEQARRAALLEVTTLTKRLDSLYPGDMPITIQLFQPIDGGRLVDVGPRPRGSDDALIFQRNDAGKTGDIFMDEQAPHRFIPRSERIGAIGKGTFSKAIMDLEKTRYPNIGTWTVGGPPPDAMIHQLPLAHLPLDLHKRPSNGQYRFANLGAVYTISRQEETEDDETRRKMLILYALRAGQIAQRIRYRTICGENNRLTHATEDSIRVSHNFPVVNWNDWTDEECEKARIDTDWKKNIDGGICLLAGKLILHHHWWFPYDPVAYHVSCLLSGSESSAKNIYYQHLCVPPDFVYCTGADMSRTPEEMIATLCEDIVYVVESFRGSRAPLSDEQKQRLYSAVLTMLVQFTGKPTRRFCDWIKEKSELIKKRTTQEVYFIDLAPNWTKGVLDTLRQSTIHSPILTGATLKNPDHEYCQYVCSLLAPHDPSMGKLDRSLRKTHGLVFIKDGNNYRLASDPNEDAPHFLYWHTRAMLARAFKSSPKKIPAQERIG
jgi:hypothetical protein